ncbi:MAG: hypothetical protein RIK87_11510 [Fuerstiella sp.]
MQTAIDFILNAGKQGLPVVILCVAVLLLISMVDRHPRNDPPPDKKNDKK